MRPTHACGVGGGRVNESRAQCLNLAPVGLNLATSPAMDFGTEAPVRKLMERTQSKHRAAKPSEAIQAANRTVYSLGGTGDFRYCRLKLKSQQRTESEPHHVLVHPSGLHRRHGGARPCHLPAVPDLYLGGELCLRRRG